jgi:dienelactone hydrolase
MDGRGLRPALFDMGERLADACYYVLLPDLFYRGGPYEAPAPDAFSRDPEFRKQCCCASATCRQRTAPRSYRTLRSRLIGQAE